MKYRWYRDTKAGKQRLRIKRNKAVVMNYKNNVSRLNLAALFLAIIAIQICLIAPMHKKHVEKLHSGICNE